MTTPAPEFVELQRDPVTVEAFAAGQATVSALSYGSGVGTLEANHEFRERFHLANPNEERYGLFGGQRPLEDHLLRQLTLFGTSEGFALYEAYELKRLAKLTAALAGSISRVPDTEAEVVSLQGIAQTLLDRQQAKNQDYLKDINDYLKARGSAYWVIVETRAQEASGDLPKGYVKLHGLAELVAIDFAEGGELHSLLRQADGKLGYIAGSTQLYF